MKKVLNYGKSVLALMAGCAYVYFVGKHTCELLGKAGDFIVEKVTDHEMRSRKEKEET